MSVTVAPTAVAAALILTMISVLAGCRDDGDQAPGAAAHPETALTEAADPGAEHAPTEMAPAYEAAPAFPAWTRPGETAIRISPAWVSARADDRAPAIVPRDSWERQGDLDWAFLADGGWRAIASDGSLWAWGGNWFGGIGDGTRERRDAPVRVGDDYDWAYVTTGGGGGSFTFGIRTDGSLWAWGRNDSAELGIGGTTHALRPVRISHTDSNRLVIGQAHHNSRPVRDDSRWISVSAGGNRRSVAVRADGTLWEWGQLTEIHAASNRVRTISRPVQVGEDSDWVSASAGSGHSVAIKADGSLWAWGMNLGNQVAEYGRGSNAPVRIGSDYGWARVWAGDMHSVAIREDGTLWAWGVKVHHGQERIESIMSYGHLPVQIGESSDWASALVWSGFTVAAKTDGSLWAWGWNWEWDPLPDMVDDWRSEGDFSAEPVRIDAEIAGEYARAEVSAFPERWAAVSAGSFRTAAIAADGSMWAWGRLGNNWGAPVHDRPVRIGEEYDWALVSNGQIALRTDGSMWGLGSPLEPIQTAPEYVWIRVDGSSSSGVALRADGSLWRWGHATGSTFLNPVRLGTRTDWIHVHQGAWSAFAIDEAGGLWAWGQNLFGELGIGTQGWDGSYSEEDGRAMIFIAAEPTQVEGGAGRWVSVSTRTSYRHYVSTVAVGADGSLWRWGSGELWGVGNLSPVRIGTDYGWATVASGSAFWGSPRTVLTKADGSLWELDRHYIPVRVGSDNDWVAAVAGGGEHETHAVALKADGALWAWGDNGVGQFGNGTRVSSDAPVRIMPRGGE